MPLREACLRCQAGSPRAAQAGLVQKAIKRYTNACHFSPEGSGTVHEELQCLIQSAAIQSGAQVHGGRTIIFTRSRLPNARIAMKRSFLTGFVPAAATTTVAK